jgi:hypothetical protein
MRFLENDKKDKVLATDIIKVNDHFILNDVALVNKLRYNQLSISQLVDADLSVFFFTNLILEFLIRLVVLFVVFFGLEMSFKLISQLLSLP